MHRLVTSDLQLDNNSRDKYRTDFFVNELPRLVSKYKVDQLIICGDLTEKKDAHPAPLVNAIVNSFDALSKICEIIMLEGNHDYLHEAHPFFEFLSCFDNISWISVPTVRDNCLYLPHTRDHKKEWSHLDFTKEYNFVFAHNIFDGVKANGMKLSGIPTKVFPEHLQVISGDVHEPQELDSGKIIYVGSPTLCDFGDDYQPRVLLLDGLNIKSIKVHGVQKRLIWCAVNKIAGKRELAFDHNANEGDIVKIQVELITEDVAEWASIRQEVELWATKNKFVVNGIIPQVAYEQGKRQQLVNSSKKSDDEYLTTFASRSGIDQKTSEVGKQIIATI